MTTLRAAFLLLAIQSSFWAIGQCNSNAFVGISPQAANGTYASGHTATICAAVLGSSQLNGSKINGFEFLLPDGWDASTINPITPPSPCGNNPGQWVYLDNLTCAGGSYGPGFYFDGASNASTDPCTNENDGCTSQGYMWNFCFEITTRTDCTSGSALDGSSLTPGIRILGESELNGADVPPLCGNGNGLTAYSNFSVTFQCCEVQAGSSPAPATNCSVGEVCLIDLLEGNPSSGGVWTLPAGDTIPNCMEGPVLPGTYTYTLTGVSGCISTAQVIIESSDLGIVQNIPYCGANPIALSSILTTGGNPLNVMAWYYPGYPDVINEVPSGIVNPQSDSSGVFTALILTANGCTTLAQINLTLGNTSSGNSFLSVVARCSSSEPFTPISYYSDPDFLGGSWIIYNQNWGFLSFVPNSQTSGFQLLLNVSNPATYYFVHVFGSPPCSPIIDTLQVNAYPAVNAGSDQSFTFCQQEGEINLFNLLPTGVSDNGSWSLEPLDIAFPGGLFDLNVYASESPIEMTYTLNGSNGICSDQAIYHIDIEPSSITLSPITVCTTGLAIGLLDAFFPYTVYYPGGIFIGPSGSVFNGVLQFNPSTDPSGLLTYVFPGNCGIVSFFRSFTVVNEFNAGLDSQFTSCQAQGILDLNSLLDANAQSGGSWSPTDLINVEASASGIYSYTLSHPGCAPDQANFSVDIQSALEAVNIVVNCTSPNFYTVSFQIQGGQPPYVVNGMPDFGGTFTSSQIPAGVPYSFSISGTSQCPGAVVTGNAPNCVCVVSASFAPVDTVLCSVQTVELDVLLTGFPPFDLTYSQNGDPVSVTGISSNTFTINFEATNNSYVELISVSNGFCSAMAAGGLAFHIADDPVTTDLGIVQTLIYCLESPVSISALLSPANALPVGAIWQGPAGNILADGMINPTLDSSGVYTAAYNDQLGCPYTQSVELYFNGGTAQNASAAVCINSGNICPFSILQEANPSIALYEGGQWILYGSNYQFLMFSSDWDNCSWSNHLGDIIDSTTFHFLYFLGSPPCTTVIDTLSLTISPTIDQVIWMEESLCGDNTLFDLNALLPSGIEPDLGWIGASQITLDPSESGIYNYQAQSGCGNDLYQFDVIISAPAILQNISVLCLDDPTQYTLSFDIAGGSPPYEVDAEGELNGNSFTTSAISVLDSAIISLSDNGPCPAQIFTFAANDTDGDGVCDEGEIAGCQDPVALNYNPLATNPGMCFYGFTGLVTGFVSNDSAPLMIGMENSVFDAGHPFTIAPNPVRSGELVWIELEGLAEAVLQIAIYDMSHRLVVLHNYSTVNSGRIPLTIPTDLASGIYAVGVFQSDDVSFKKIMVTR